MLVTSRLSQTALPSLLTDIVGYWNFQTTSWLDFYRNNNLTGNGSPVTGTGKIGNCVDLEASSSQFLSCADSALLRGGDRDYSFAGWFNAESFDNDGTFLFGKTINNSDFCAGVLFESGFKVFFDLFASNVRVAHAIADNGGSQLAVSTWYFFYAQFVTATQTAGVSINNGALQTSVASSPPASNTEQFCVGARNPVFGPRYWDGLIDELGRWNRILTSTEITFLFNNGNARTAPFF